MGHIYKIVPTPPYRMNNIQKAQKNNMFIFDSRYFFNFGEYTYVYGYCNKEIILPFTMNLVRDIDGVSSKIEIDNCYNIYGYLNTYMVPGYLYALCIKNLDRKAFQYGFTGFDDKEII